MFNHPEVSKYGLELDFESWREFNKEKMIRKLLRKQSLKYTPNNPFTVDDLFLINDERLMKDYILERNLIAKDLESLAKKKLINFNYLEESEIKKMKDDKKEKVYFNILKIILAIIVICFIYIKANPIICQNGACINSAPPNLEGIHD